MATFHEKLFMHVLTSTTWFFVVKSIIYSNSTANSILATDKRRLEGDLRGMQQELDNFMSQIKNSEEKTKKAMADAGRLADELRCDYFYDCIYKETFVKKLLNNFFLTALASVFTFYKIFRRTLKWYE